MKRLIKYTRIYGYILVALLLLSSCSDFLDRDPEDSLSPSTFWKTEKDAYLALVGCYNSIEGATSLLYMDCMSDNAYNFHRHEGYQAYAAGDLSASETGASWFNFEGIHRCNNFLENIDNIEFKNPELKTMYISEVRFLRAYFYFIRTMFYGDFPLFTENFEKPDDAKIPRTSKEEVQGFIIDELKDIIPGLPSKEDVVADGRISKGAAQALLMRFYLYLGEYEQAQKWARAIEGYTLFEDGYEELFLVANQHCDEIILGIQRVENDYSLSFTPFLPNSAGGWSSVVPTQQLVDAYETNEGLTINEAQAEGKYDPFNPYLNRDPRLRATIIYPGQNWNNKIYNSVLEGNEDYPTKANNATKTGYNFKKFISNIEQYPNGYWNTARNIFMFRYAEVLLTIVEAKIELNQIDDEVYDNLNKIRHRAGMPEVNRLKYKDQDSLRELLRRERRVEFAYEGLRRFDIVRWSIAEDVMNISLTGCNRGIVLETIGDAETGDHNVKLDGEPFFVEQRVWSDNLRYMPVPQTAIDKNPSLEQNPGY